MRKNCFIFLFMLMSSVVSANTPIYKWIDGSGGVHFSDNPQEGAEQIILPSAQTYTPPIPHVAHREPIGEGSPMSEMSQYSSIKIVQPTEQVTIRNPQGFVSIVLEIKPKLRKGDQVQILLDGLPVDKPMPTTVFALQGVLRGSHMITAQIVNLQGQVLIKSGNVNIFMQQPRVGMGSHSP